MNCVQKRVQKPRRIAFPSDVRALVRGLGKLDLTQRNFILCHLLHFGPENQKREVEFYLRCVLGD